MKHNIFYSILAATSAIIGLSSCEKESIFNTSQEEGQLDCRSLNVDYINSGRQTRADNVNLGDFDVYFIKTETGDTVKTYKYADMPEMVTLPKGDYRAEAVYGDNPIAQWDSPYYKGNSTFSITPGKITENIDPVECELSNIRIRVNIDDLGLGIVGDDAKVVVKVGNQGSLTYDKSTNNRSGFFRYITDSHSITATFSGTVDGVYVDGITRAYDNAAGGNSYVINFTITKPDEIEPGGIQIGDDNNSGIFVDATISIKDENIVIDPDDSKNDEEIKNDMRPVEDPLPNNPDNDNPNQGGTTEPGNTENPGDDDPAPAAKGPQIILPEGQELGKPWHVDATSVVAFTVTSETGITEFLINIDSTTLTPDELEGANLSANLNLIEPGEFEEGLLDLQFPVKDDVKGQTSVSFDISGFIPLLNILGSGSHKFNLTISDQSGTTHGTIWLEN